MTEGPRINTAFFVAVVVMAATLCGVVHGYSYYAVFGVNYFELGTRDDFIITALRSPIAFVLVLIIWAKAYSKGINPQPMTKAAFFSYIALPAIFVACLGAGQAALVRNGFGKVIGQPSCKLTIAYTENRSEDIFGVTPLGSSGKFVIFWIYQLKEVRIVSDQAAKSVSCNVGS